MSYPTTAEAKAYIGTSGDDTIVAQILDGAIETVEQYTRRRFIAHTATRNFPGKKPYVTQGRKVLTFFEDLSVITSVTNGDGTVVAASDYTTQPVRGAPFHSIKLTDSSGKIFWEGSDGTQIAVAGTWSYSANCPDDIFLLLLQITHMSFASQQDGAGVTLTRTGGIVDKGHWTDEMVRILNGKTRA